MKTNTTKTVKRTKTCRSEAYIPGRAPLKCGLPKNHGSSCCDIEANVAWRGVVVLTPAMNLPHAVHTTRVREADGSITVYGRASLEQVLAADLTGRALAPGDRVEVYRRIDENRSGQWQPGAEKMGKVLCIEGLDEITVEVDGETRRVSSADVWKKV